MLNLLEKFHIFQGLAEKDLQGIASISRLHSFPKGACIFKAGDPAEFLFMVNKGKIELRFPVSYHDVSTEMALEKLSEGDTFGWSALTPPYRYTLSAFATEDAELVQIKESDIKRICQDNYPLGYVLMGNIAQIIGHRFSLIQGILVQEIQRDIKKKESSS